MVVIADDQNRSKSVAFRERLVSAERELESEFENVRTANEPKRSNADLFIKELTIFFYLPISNGWGVRKVRNSL